MDIECEEIVSKDITAINKVKHLRMEYICKNCETEARMILVMIL